MAGLHSSHKPTSSYSSSSSLASRLLLLLTVLLLTLAAFAFILQWRGGLDDSMTRWLPDDRPQFPGTGGSGPVRKSSSDCVNGLAQRSSPSFPYSRDWKFSFGGSDLKPKVSPKFDIYFWVGLLMFLGFLY